MGSGRRMAGIFISRILIFIFSATALTFAQPKKEIKITPYNIETTYEKLKKDHPFITAVGPEYTEGINVKEDVVYRTLGNRKLKADIYYPKTNGVQLSPAVLLIHGGGWISGSKENKRPMAQRLAQEGFAAITVEYRLSREAPYPAGVIDIKAALNWIRKNAAKYNIDENKIAVLGASAGAQLATLVGVTPGSNIYKENDCKIRDEVQAIVNIDGIVSFIHPEAAAEGEIAGLWLGGLKEENPSSWREASPLEYTGDSTPPIIFINSTQPRFHAGRDDMIKILDANGIYSEINTIPNTPHSFWLVHPWFETTLNYTVEFLNKVFKK
ncbi:MAG TPA: alpha/beta hydrolase [Gillisia sp.]|nr:alpha/beta hydrolase [Gillisia sp.]